MTAELQTGEEEAVATGRVEAEGIESETRISLAMRAETEMPSEAGREGTTDRMLAPAATAVPRAWAREAEVGVEEAAVVEVEVAVVGAGRRRES